MATNTLDPGNASARARTPIGTATALLAVYTAFYLAVVGVIHFMSSPDATAAITTPTTAAASAPVPSTRAPDEMPGARLRDPGTASPASSRECALDAGIDSECIFN